jgi:exodeoxyribonuclease-3
MSKLRIVTWNINSVRLRLPLLEKLTAELKPDIIALQETKCMNDAFPLKGIQKLGFEHHLFHGMKSYNGVAILSKLPLIDTTPHIRVDKDDCRHVEAAVTLPDRKLILHNLYIPAGGDIPDVTLNDKFAHKLNFVREMTDFFPKRYKKDENVIALGDFNIAPYEHDVWSHKQLLDVVSHTPIEVDLLNKMRASLDWVDAARHFVPETEKLYSWWSYRNQDWRKSNRGRRLDHIWVTPKLKDKLHGFSIAKDARDWTQPSDHVPVVLDLKF